MAKAVEKNGQAEGKTSLRERQRAFARAQFLNEGLLLFEERGYAQTTIEELANRCGCAKGTLYAHFPDGKDEVVREIYAAIGVEFDHRFEILLADRGDSVLECVDAAAEVLGEISTQPARGRFFMISAPALPSVLGDKLGRTGRGIVALIAERIETAQAAGEIDRDLNPENTGRLVLGLLREFGIRVAAGEASEDELKTALDGLLRGALVGHPPAPAA